MARLSLLIALTWTTATVGIRIWPNPGSLPTSIPASCRAALSADVACGPDLISAQDLENSVAYNKTFLNEYCNSACTKAFSSWSSTIQARCGTTKIYDFGGGFSDKVTEVYQPLLWARNVSCLTDSTTRAYCLPDITNGTIQPCADCTLKYISNMLGSEYGNVNYDEADFTSLASSCKVNPTEYPHGIRPSDPAPTSTPVPLPTCYGSNYTVQKGDTCASIAKKNSLAIDRFLAQNSLDPNCTALIPGSSVCIGDACLIYQIQAHDTCATIVHGKAFSEVQFKAWNPVIGGNCKDLSSLKDHTVCISPPGTSSYVSPTTAETNSTWTLPDSWTSVPTHGTSFRTTDYWPTISTTTGIANMTGYKALEPYLKYCPVTQEDVDAGFLWDYLPDNCQDLLDPYCSPILTGPTPTSTSFPSSCMPTFYLPPRTSL